MNNLNILILKETFFLNCCQKLLCYGRFIYLPDHLSSFHGVTSHCPAKRKTNVEKQLASLQWGLQVDPTQKNLFSPPSDSDAWAIPVRQDLPMRPVPTAGLQHRELNHLFVFKSHQVLGQFVTQQNLIHLKCEILVLLIFSDLRSATYLLEKSRNTKKEKKSPMSYTRTNQEHGLLLPF